MSSDKAELDQDNHKNKIIKKATFNGLVFGIIILVGISAFFAGSYTANMNSNHISDEDLEDAIAKLELKLLQNQLPTQKAALPAKISADNDPIIGNPDAAITIIEFSDFQCPFCARFHVQTLPSIMEQYIEQGKVSLVFRDFPIQNIHPNALPAAVTAECANEQGRFKEMHDILFEKQNEWNNQETFLAVSLFIQYADNINLDQEVFESCINSGKYIDEIRKDLEDGRDYGVTGTPGFFVGNDEIGYVEIKGAQPFDSFKKVIDAQLDA
ncbi:DsbA family protein [Nitrosopumilus sp.]|uniref:DsbA family protein n=1 Tax=Nitrosopumilus sp. TaxID=2024843 RepID=UPI00292DCF40|nr:thioredoxin domain-containing protein [Nitrosopumilus sp.]